MSRELEQQLRPGCSNEVFVAQKTFGSVAFLTKWSPSPPKSGDAIYSSQLLSLLGYFSKRICVVCVERPSGDAVMARLPLYKCLYLEKGEWSLYRYIFSLNSKYATRVDRGSNRMALTKYLQDENVDAIVIDHIDQTWALSAIRKYMRAAPIKVALIYMTHNEETSSRLSIALEVGPCRGVLYLVDAIRAYFRDLQVLEASQIVTCITSKDEKCYRSRGNCNTVVLSPLMGDSVSARRDITNSISRKVVIVGSYLWSAKLLNLWHFLERAEPILSNAGVHIEVIGKMSQQEIARIQKKFLRVKVLGEVEDLGPFLADARIGLLVDRSGGGFKLTALTYARNRIPIAAISTALPDSDWKHHCVVADDAVSLARNVLDVIDDIEQLNEMQNRLFDLASTESSLSKNIVALDIALGGLSRTQDSSGAGGL